MNPVVEAIKKRRSVRAYDPKPLPEDVIKEIIGAGNEAPSGMNSQPWRFVVVREEGLKRRLLLAALPNAKKLLEHVKETNPERHAQITKRFEEMEDPIYYSAPAVVFVIGRGLFAPHSCPLACQNIMLAAYSLGVGSCWVGFGSMVTEDSEVGKALELKDGEEIYGPILLGYPKTYPEPPKKRPPEIKWL